jgi:predicted transcriptional regulator of viral defense system
MPGRVFNEVLALAAEQNGFVRTREVRELGVDPRRLNDYARRGLAERVGRGLYRIQLVPPGDLDEFARAVQWPDGRGTLSGETALDLHELCDVSPAHIDITVPPGYRTHRVAPTHYRLHRRELAPDEVTRLRDVPIVTPVRAIADGIELGLRPTLIAQAIETAARQALITTEQEARLRDMARHPRQPTPG